MKIGPKAMNSLVEVVILLGFAIEIGVSTVDAVDGM